MKNLTLIVLLLFLYSCGYSSIYKGLDDQDFQITIKEMIGDKEMNNLLKNEMSLYSNKNSINQYEITVNTNYEKKVIAKDGSGLSTDFEISVYSTFTIYFDQDSREITLNETINIKNQTDSFEQDFYEKNIKRNFASSLREKLISEIITLE